MPAWKAQAIVGPAIMAPTFSTMLVSTYMRDVCATSTYDATRALAAALSPTAKVETTTPQTISAMNRRP